ncbi:MAG: hypothetical protein FD173_940 [Gallionellaceae bacterium]|nr:MAG: hypothetical protein FD173_940 [Gallionellaceae bacterium]
MTKFIYQGLINSGFTLKEDGKEDREVLLFIGQSIDLPEDHEHVKMLRELKHLVPDPAQPPAKAAKAAAALSTGKGVE